MPVMTDANATITDKPDRPLLAELKNGKPVLKQKPLAFEKMSETMQEIVKFREMLEQKIERGETPLHAFPDDHRPLVAKMVHESDKTLQALSKHIQHELLPAQDEDDEEASKTVSSALPLDIIEKAIKSVATRTNYGLEASQAPNGRIPASWQVWRWEVREECREWLPKASREKVGVRLGERVQAKLDIAALFNALPEAEREALVGTKSTAGKGSKAKAKSSAGESSTTTTKKEVPADASTGSPKAKKSGTENANENANGQKDEKDKEGSGTPSKSGVGRPKKPVDPEKAAKEKEREEKRLAKLEKEKKAQDAQTKSRNLMASFFAKPKVVASGSGSRSGSVPTANANSNNESVAATAETRKEDAQESQFERVFRPFVLKKDAEMASESGNWFRDVRRREREGREVIVIDDDQQPPQAEDDGDVIMLDSNESAGDSVERDRLRESLSSLPPSLKPPLLPYPPHRHPTLRTHHPLSVRSTLHALTEAEVSGDVPTVRHLLSRLSNRSVFPAKVLIFHEDARPGYFGTWTRNSKEVGGRRPFGRDVVSLDYGVDSGEEWEDEEDEGEVIEGDGDGEEEEEEQDSDLDSWLVDDDEVEDPGTPIDERMGSPEFFSFPPAGVVPLQTKRKAKEGEGEGGKEREKKRKVVVPLVPFTKGPCWESRIGECGYEPFEAYRIQLFNDTPLPIDPFTFQASPVDDTPIYSHTNKPSAYTTSTSSFVVPPLPSRLNLPTLPSSSSTSNTTHPSTSGSSTALQKKPAAPPPKTTFPDAQMPFLIAKIAELDTGNMAFIVESIYKDLSHQHQQNQSASGSGGGVVKKNAIEARVREVCEKEGERGRKVWCVRGDVKVRKHSKVYRR
ncbi:hypothetical protein BC629DRAFT_1579368 [Irpex lacteus]|nr:hypothetical protein BC629DRAFT_1579368 [Irpex lacteus]